MSRADFAGSAGFGAAAAGFASWANAGLVSTGAKPTRETKSRTGSREQAGAGAASTRRMREILAVAIFDPFRRTRRVRGGGSEVERGVSAGEAFGRFAITSQRRRRVHHRNPPIPWTGQEWNQRLDRLGVLVQLPDPVGVGPRPPVAEREDVPRDVLIEEELM